MRSKGLRIVKKLGLALSPAVLLLIFLFTTNPQALPAVLLLIPFVLLFSCVFSLVYWTSALLSFGRINGKRRLMLSFCLALLPTLLLLLQSINQLTARDILIFSLFIFILVMYIFRINAVKH